MSDPQILSEKIAARLDRFERDLGYTAPELWHERIAVLKVSLLAIVAEHTDGDEESA